MCELNNKMKIVKFDKDLLYKSMSVYHFLMAIRETRDRITKNGTYIGRYIYMNNKDRTLLTHNILHNNVQYGRIRGVPVFKKSLYEYTERMMPISSSNIPSGVLYIEEKEG